MVGRILSVIAALLLTLPAVANAQDASQWSGAYGGVLGSMYSGDMQYDAEANTRPMDGNTFGLFLGYNYATGPWVIGAELAATKGAITTDDGPGWQFDYMVDLKARAGHAAGNVLVYGTLGGTMTQFTEDGSPPPGVIDSGSGFLYGVGVDYQISPSFFVGAEYVARDLRAKWNNSDGDLDGDLDADLNTISLRAGLKF